MSSEERKDYSRQRQIYLKSLDTRAGKMPPRKALKQIWLRSMACHLADREREQELHMEIQVIALAASEVKHEQ